MDCKYHVVIVPKYRQKRFFGSRRGKIGEILRQLCQQKDIGLLEGHAMPDHVNTAALHGIRQPTGSSGWILLLLVTLKSEQFVVIRFL